VIPAVVGDHLPRAGSHLLTVAATQGSISGRYDNSAAVEMALACGSLIRVKLSGGQAEVPWRLTGGDFALVLTAG